MTPQLNAEEKEFVDDLLKWDRSSRNAHRVVGHIFLALGAVMFVSATLLFLQNMNDRTGLYVMLPGGLAVVVFGLLYLGLERCVRRNDLCSSVLRKLSAG